MLGRSSLASTRKVAVKPQLHPTMYNPSILLKDWSNSPNFGDEMRQTGEDMDLESIFAAYFCQEDCGDHF